VLGELNKLFDRDFAVGHFLPGLAFVAATIGLLARFGVPTDWFTFDRQDALKDTTLVALLSWVAGITLMALNREIFRFLEGYWPRQPEWLQARQRKRFRELEDAIGGLGSKQNQVEATPPARTAPSGSVASG
jgi:hypothetical protein